MKTIRYLMGMVVAATALCACENSADWDAYIEREFVEYVPYSNGDIVIFESEEGKSREMKVEVMELFNTPCPNNPFIECASLDAGVVRALFTCDTTTYYYTVGAAYRERFFFEWGTEKEKYEYNEECGTTQELENLDDLKRCLTERLECGDGNGVIVARGKGLVECTIDGVKWTLKE